MRALTIHSRSFWIAVISFGCLLLSISSLTGRDFAVTPFAAYDSLVQAGWELSTPLYSPDSSLVMFDIPGNIDFTPVQKESIAGIPGAMLISSSMVYSWQLANEWIVDDE